MVAIANSSGGPPLTPVEDVYRQHETIRELLTHLAKLAHEIERNLIVPEAEVQEGLRLLEEYLDKVHIPLCGSGGQGVDAHALTRDRLRSLRQMVNHYNTKFQGVRHAVARSVLLTAAAEVEGEKREEDWIRKGGIPTPSSPPAAETRSRLEEGIRHYLDPARKTPLGSRAGGNAPGAPAAKAPASARGSSPQAK
jgi:hypothetical protein